MKRTLVTIDPALCNGCGLCVNACHEGALRMVDGKARLVSDSVCDGLGACLPECPTGAITLVEREAAPAPEPRPAAANWPVQLKLASPGAPCFKNAALLVAADCTAFTCPDLHRRFMPGKATLIGCPKLDGADYSEKLAAILQANDIRSVTVLRMEVPCCAGIANAVRQALANTGQTIPWRIVTIATNGAVIEE